MAVVSNNNNKDYIEKVKAISPFPMLFGACKPKTGPVRQFLAKHNVEPILRIITIIAIINFLIFLFIFIKYLPYSYFSYTYFTIFIFIFQYSRNLLFFLCLV